MSLITDAVKIKRWREERHWSQEHLADLAGLGLRTVQRIESGEAASPESLRALAAAYCVDVTALSFDPRGRAADALRQKNARARAALRLSLWIHLAGFAIGVAVFVGISLGAGSFVMLWPLIWWTVGVVAHGATLMIIEAVTRYQDRLIMAEGHVDA